MKTICMIIFDNLIFYLSNLYSNLSEYMSESNPDFCH